MKCDIKRTVSYSIFEILRERERPERVKGQKEEEMYERKSIRDGVEKDK